MRIKEVPDVASALLAAARSHKSTRPTGWHQSDHNACLRKSVIKRLLAEKFPSLIPGEEWLVDERTALMFLRGAGIGAFLSEHRNEEVFYADGFGWCSIDRPWQDPNGREVPMELKTTRFSSAYPITEHENYISQLATYVVKKARREQGGVERDERYYGYIYALFEQGDYVVRKPEQRAFEFEFSGRELLVWEQELDQRHGHLEQSYRALEQRWESDPHFQLEFEKLADYIPADVDFETLLPPVSEHYEWECNKYDECPVKALINCPGTSDNGRWGLPFVVESESYVREHRVRKEPKPKKAKE